MITQHHNGHEIVLNDSISELPIERYVAFNRHLMADAEIGGSVSDYDQRLRRAAGFVQKGDTESAIIELNNARLTVRNCMAGLSPKMMAFATLVEEIDGTRYTRHDETELKRIISRLSSTKTTWSLAEEWIESVKKKWTVKRRSFLRAATETSKA